MAEFEFRQIDVFTDRPLAGNPLAVVLDADEMDGETMQAVAAETNLSETAFVLRPTEPTADYRLRIFTPTTELPFAGHPSVGTAFALLREGRFGSPQGALSVRQEVGIGVLPIKIESTVDGPLITMTQGRPEVSERVEDAAGVAAALGCAADQVSHSRPGPRVASTGLRQLMVPLASVEAVSLLRPEWSELALMERRLDVTGVSAFALDGPGRVRCRFFSPRSGIMEDPATGSAAGALGAYMAVEGMLDVEGGTAGLTVYQGLEIRRPSRIDVRVRVGGRVPKLVEVGGRCVTVLRGTLSI